MKIVPVIICGGAGTRLFPENKNNLPKQFIDFGGWTMFQKTLERIKSPIYSDPIISTNIKYVSIVKKFLKKYKVNKFKIILEPSKQNTAPAILASALLPFIKPNQPILFLPSDQIIEQNYIFNQSILKNLNNIFYKDVFIFGIKPTEPSDQYGYFYLNRNKNTVSKFIEKPSVKIAKKILKNKGYWNAGIFLATKETLIYHFMNCQKDIFKNTLQSILKAKYKKNEIFLDKKFYIKNKKISFDYAILEKIKSIKAITLKLDWSDLGSWMSITNLFKKNKKKYYNKKNLFKRPWGTYRNLFKGKNFLIKELVVNPKGCLSLQSHKYRSEHWNVFEGKPLITLNKKSFYTKKNDLIYIPQGAIHRIHNKFKQKVKIIEAQIGSVLKETDIKRYEDIYGRVKK